ncbi:MAG: VWA domain-containing protein [Acidobacteria bacterium]|nr:MAG: VWA domain-containing protein [Acidobacteriota bacterium]
MWRGVFWFASTVACLAVSLLGQEDIDNLAEKTSIDTGFRLKVRADWVYVNASVWGNRKRASVVDLRKEDFLLYEDGQLRSIDACLPSETPFHLLLLLDVSGSTSSFIQLIREAARKFTDQLKPGDRIAIMTFHSEAVMIQPFTNNRESAKVAIDQIRPEGSTAFYDAAIAALRAFRDIQERKAIVIFSDGADNQLVSASQGSKATFEQLRQAVRETDCMIYTVLLLPFEPDRYRDDVLYRASAQLASLAEETGGRSFKPRKARDLAATYGEIANDLRYVYTLTFTPGLPRSGGWHDLKLQIKAREGVVTRCRPGYFTIEETGAAE